MLPARYFYSVRFSLKDINTLILKVDEERHYRHSFYDAKQYEIDIVELKEARKIKLRKVG